MRILYNILLILVFIAGLTFLCLSFIPFPMVKSFVDSLSFGGRVSFFTPEYFSTIVNRLRLSSFLIFMLFVLLVIFRGFLEKSLSFLSSFGEYYYDFKNDAINNLTSLIEYNKYDLLSFCLIFLAGVGLRIYYLSTPVRFDEAGLFLLLSSKPLFVSLVSYPTTGHHVFYTIMVNILYNILGDDVWVLRLPALLAGILLIPAVYLLFKTISDNVTSLLAATLVATSSPLIEYSTNGRGYTTVTLIFILSLLIAHYLSTHRNIFAWSLLIFLSGSRILYYSNLFISFRHCYYMAHVNQHFK